MAQPPNLSTHAAYDTLPRDGLPVAVDNYIKKNLHSSTYHSPFETIREASLAAGLPDIACSETQAKFLMLQARMCNAKRILEVGTLGGYSAAWFATTSPETKVTTIEVDEDRVALARQNLKKAGLSQQVDVVHGWAITVLQDIREQVQNHEREVFDFAFIDANKQDNLAYFKLALEITRDRAVIIVDNVVRNGKVASAEEAEKDNAIKGTRDLIESIGRMEDVVATAIQTVGEKNYDGFLIAMKK